MSPVSLEGMEKKLPWRVLRVGGASRERRLDTWLAAQLPELTRRQAQGMVAAGEVLVDGHAKKKGAQLEPGSVVEIFLKPRPAFWQPAPDPSLPLEVVYEDQHIIAVSKPSGVPTVPHSPEETSTLAGALVARFPECAPLGRRPGDGGLIQRLDRETSGIVVAARSASILESLVEKQSRDELKKTYLALVRRSEAPLPHRIDEPLASAGASGQRVKVSAHGKSATTRLRQVSEHGQWLLIEAFIHQGRRHQIRAHLEFAGFPIAGDATYGPGAPPPGLERLFLHAAKVSFLHPVTKESLNISSPLSAELRDILEGLRVVYD